MMNLKTANFEDLYKAYYIGTGAVRTAINLKQVHEGLLRPDSLEPFFPKGDIELSSPILFSPFSDLLKFYSLLEIAFIIKCIPEPVYTEHFWQETLANLASPFTKLGEQSNYPVLLPQFLMGRLEGRLHLEEEGANVRFADLFGIFQSFTSIISRWRDRDVETFLRFVLSPESDQAQLDAFRKSVGNKDEFISRIVISHSARTDSREHLVHGLSEVLSVCDDLDQLLSDAKAFPLVQSAMWNYHADLFEAVHKRLPAFLAEVVESFSEWVTDEPESERALEVHEYIRDVKKFMDRLGSGAYGGALNPEILRPRVMA